MYMTVEEIVTKAELLAEQFPDIVTVSTLPQTTHDGRSMQLLRVAAGPKGPKHALYVQAGIHAREWGTVDTVMHFVEQLLVSHRDGTDVRFGNHTFAAADIRAAMERVELLILPCVNPDGRDFSMQPGNDERNSPKVMWRKNRRDNGNAQCFGVDLNRNLDWIWDYRTKTNPDSWLENTPNCQGVIVVSDDVCNDTFHGPKPFSEPETLNIRSVLDGNPHIRVFVDVHGVLGKVMTPWADDEVQTTHPDQNFTNPAHDGKRGLKDALDGSANCQNQTPNPDGPAYKEFMHAVDKARHEFYGTLQRDAIHSVRNTNYRTGTSYLEMYGMSGNCNDFAFSRHLADLALAKIDGYIYEVENIGGLGFQPPFEEPPGATDMIHVIRDVAAGLTALLLNTDRIPFVETSPARLGFGRVRVGTTAAKGIALINRGIRAIDIGPVSLLDAAGPFAISGTSPTHLDPGAMAVITVNAAPTAAGRAASRVAIEFAHPNETVRDVRIVPCTVDGCTVAQGACAAPVFPATRSWLTCLLQSILWGTMIVALALFAWIPSVRCTIKQLMFRIRHCQDGNSDPCRLL